MAFYNAGPSINQSGSQLIITHSISGATPGLLDPTQPTRLLRHPTHRLSFASFDPLTATAASDQRRRSIQLHGSNRVVIETTPDGESFWRFVPSARQENRSVDEGDWPRVVKICGYVINVPFSIEPEYCV
jgi:hypothetical protein